MKDIEPGTGNGWDLPELTDFWNQKRDAIATFSDRLRRIDDPGELTKTFEQITAAVTDHVERRDDNTLKQDAVTVFEDLFEAARLIEIWDESVEDYLVASASRFVSLLHRRGIIVQHLVNCWAEGPGRPLVIFPTWYNAAGIFYCCPQQMLYREQAPGTAIPERFDPYDLDLCREVFNDMVPECHSVGACFIQLDLDPTANSYRTAERYRDRPGVVTVTSG